MKNIMMRLAIMGAGLLLVVGRVWAQDEDTPVDKPLQEPPRIEEVIVAEPGEDAIWIPGHWDRKKGDWVWKKGEWVHHPLPNAYWLPSHWEEHDGKWRWHNGHWASAPAGYVVTRVIEVPAAINEVRPPKPSDKDHWIPGYWEWTAGTWQWIPGRWTNKPADHAEWVVGAWNKYEGQDQWRWISGHWKAQDHE